MVLEIHLLSFIIWFPIFIGSFILCLKENFFGINLTKFLSILTSIICLYFCYYIYINFDKNLWNMQFIEHKAWINVLGINYSLGIDGISLPLIILNCFMTFIVILYSFNVIKKHIVQYYSYFLIMQGLVCGVFSALDSILFYVFFEAMLIPMFLIIGIWGGNNRVYATIKFFLYTFFGSIFFLISLIYIHFVLFFNNMDTTFSILKFQSVYLSLNQQKWLFWGMIIAFAIKVPMWPVHTWLPDAHVEAPTGGSVILAAITLKVGGYGILRFLLPIVPDGCMVYSSLVIILSFIAIIYIGLIAMVQIDMKKLVAYSSISHMGFVTLGCFLLFEFNFGSRCLQSSIIGLDGAIIQMISHGFISGALFICVGILYERLHTKLIVKYGGVVNKMPIFASFFMIFAMANSGLPGTSGFIGEFSVILAIFKVNYIYALLAGITLIFGAAYTLWMYKRVIFGSIINKEIENFNDINLNELTSLMFLAFFIILFGIWPYPILELIDSSVEHLLQQAIKSKIFTVGV